MRPGQGKGKVCKTDECVEICRSQAIVIEMRTLVSGVDMLFAGVLYIFTNNNCEDGYRVCLQKILQFTYFLHIISKKRLK